MLQVGAPTRALRRRWQREAAARPANPPRALRRLIHDRRMLWLVAAAVVTAGVATVVEAVLLRG